ncbi:MAG: Lpg1974 family pore-forming outer membrane protein [Parachlamydiales bacterium]
MKTWLIGGIAALALPIMTFAQTDTGTNKGYRNATGSVCSDGGSCNRGCCAQPCGDCCQPSCCGCCGHWSLEGAALYWRTCYDDEVFFPETDGHLRTVKPDNEWGFKIKGQYTSCDQCKFASLTYWYFDETDHGRVFDSSDFEISGRIHHEYQRLSGRVGHYCCQGCKGGLYGYGGISWIYIRDRSRHFIENEVSITRHQRGEFQAAGFEAGVGGHYKICGGFGIAAELGTVAAIGDRKSRADETITVTTHIHYPSVTLCVPGLDTKLEAFYECNWCCFNWGLFVGYEQHYFWNVKKNRPFDFFNGFARSQDFGVGGLYFGARVGY